MSVHSSILFCSLASSLALSLTFSLNRSKPHVKTYNTTFMGMSNKFSLFLCVRVCLCFSKVYTSEVWKFYAISVFDSCYTQTHSPILYKYMATIIIHKILNTKWKCFIQFDQGIRWAISIRNRNVFVVAFVLPYSRMQTLTHTSKFAILCSVAVYKSG